MVIYDDWLGQGDFKRSNLGYGLCKTWMPYITNIPKSSFPK